MCGEGHHIDPPRFSCSNTSITGYDFIRREPLRVGV